MWLYHAFKEPDTQRKNIIIWLTHRHQSPGCFKVIISGQKGAVDNCQPPLCKNAIIRTKKYIYNKIQQTHWPFTPWQSHKALNKLQTQRLCWPASREFPLARRASVSSNLKNCDCWDLLSRQEPKLHRQVVQYRPCIDHVWPWVSWWIMVDIQCGSPHFYAHIQHNLTDITLFLMDNRCPTDASSEPSPCHPSTTPWLPFWRRSSATSFSLAWGRLHNRETSVDFN